MSSKNTKAIEKQFYVSSVAPEELSDYMFVVSMILGATAMFIKVPVCVFVCIAGQLIINNVVNYL